MGRLQWSRQNSQNPTGAELVTDEVGWRVPPGDAGALAEALRGACADDEKGPRAREHVLAHFSLEAQVQGVLAAHA